MTRTVRRILMTGDAVGGVWTYALDLSRALGAHGIEVVLAIMGPAPTAAQRAQARAIASLQLVDSGYRLEWMDEPWGDVTRAAGWLLALERRYAPELVHVNGYVHGALPFRAPVLVVGHSCVLSWWEAVRGEPAPARYARYREQVRAGLRAADCIVAPTRAMLRALHRHYGALDVEARARNAGAGARHGALRRTYVLPNGCDLELFVPRPKRPSVVAAGRVWDEAKNLQSLARVAPELPWPVLIAGQAEAPGQVRGEHAVHQAHGRLLGALSRPALADLFGEASICAFPARYEPFGLAALEAAACASALVLGDIPSLRELWDGAARFVPPGDDAALAEAIRQLASDRSECASFGARARARAQSFGLVDFAERYCALYEQLASTGRGRAPLGVNTRYASDPRASASNLTHPPTTSHA